MHIVRTFQRAAAVQPGSELTTVALTLAQRRRSRQRLTLANGEELALALKERDTVLHAGDELVADDGARFRVQAAPENVLRVTAETHTQLTRAAYHLGNRHVLLEVGTDYLQLEFDAVLVDMLRQLGGVRVERVNAPFEPETGAYGGGHHHGHDATFAEDYALAQAAYHAHDAGHAPTHADGDTHHHAHGHTDDSGSAP
jgi:urease accessory protein